MRGAAAALLGSLLLTGCPTAPSDPPPPVHKPEIPTAPPQALGALAAGTDAAPRPDLTPPGGEVEPDVPPQEPAPATPEGSAAPEAPDAAPEPPATPTAPAPGMAL